MHLVGLFIFSFFKVNGEVVKSSSAEKVQPSQTLKRLGPALSGLRGILKEEVDPFWC